MGGDSVNHISELTATEPDSVSKALLFRTVATGGGEVIEKGHSEQEASYGRDAFAKVLHNCLPAVLPLLLTLVRDHGGTYSYWPVE